MRSALRSFLPGLAVLLLPFSARAMELGSPSPGSMLHGGSVAFLEWSAGTLPAGAEEWEAFLSVDGGRYYAFRITPHLDADIHRFAFIVPNVGAADARIMLRAGDEVRESRFEVPGSFRIVRNERIGMSAPQFAGNGRAEAARDGDDAVLEWSEGPRSGVGVRQESRPALPVPAVYDARAGHLHFETALCEPRHAHGAPAGTDGAFGERTCAGAPVHVTSLRRSLDILLVCSRLNV